VTLPKAVEDALQRGVPLYFVPSATLWQAALVLARRAHRPGQPHLAAGLPAAHVSWRVGLGGLNQTYPRWPRPWAP
jgi:hypothetical protein